MDSTQQYSVKKKAPKIVPKVLKMEPWGAPWAPLGASLRALGAQGGIYTNFGPCLDPKSDTVPYIIKLRAPEFN